MFEPRLAILPHSQRSLWGELSQVPREFVLYGGTAVALHLGHRQSVDFDFFGNRAFNPQITLKALSYFGDGNLPQLPQATQDRLARAARMVDLDRLPTIVVATPQDRSPELEG